MLLDKDISAYQDVMDFCSGLHDKEIRSPYLLAYMLDVYSDKLEQAGAADEGRSETLSKALEVNLIWITYFVSQRILTTCIHVC